MRRKADPRGAPGQRPDRRSVRGGPRRAPELAGAGGLTWARQVPARAGIRARAVPLCGTADRTDLRRPDAALHGRLRRGSRGVGRALGALRGVHPGSGPLARRKGGPPRAHARTGDSRASAGGAGADRRSDDPHLGSPRSGDATAGRRVGERALRMAAPRDRGRGRRCPAGATRGIPERVGRRPGWEPAMNYRLAYAIGFHPWEDLAEHPPFANKLQELVGREEEGREPPYGRALDLGTGSGVWGVQLAKRGWQVTGVDVVAKALGRARRRADEEGVELRLAQADVTALTDADVGSGFRLLLDTGTFHGLDGPQRAAMGMEVSAIAGADATLILDCFAPRRRGPLPRGVSRADVERAFPEWEVTDVEVADTEPDPIARAFKFEERFYRLRRV